MNERNDRALSNFLLDSDIIIDHLRGHQPATDFLDALLLDGAVVYFSVISEAEIYSNVRPGEEPRISALFASLTRVALNGETARKGGQYRQTYRRSHGLRLPDALIAATAFTKEAVLVTRNIRHFPMTDIQVLAPY
ncbi:MAG: type II toxin-antitoxin system VapC family toxin [Chloroflexi bacterium]|nr:type II toxin-antitoxin system VapC family toxin [Chloroflexota bacterium]